MNPTIIAHALRSRVLTVILGGLVVAGMSTPSVARAAVDAFLQARTTVATLTVDGSAFEIKDFSFGVENPTTIGSATGGAGAGKVKFNEFTIKKTSDLASPAFFKNCAAGTHYQKVVLEMRKAGGNGSTAGKPFLRFTFETVFTTKIDWSGPGDEGPEESITFVYGKLLIEAAGADGRLESSGSISPTQPPQ